MNQPIARVFKPEERASDCYDWITAEEAVRHALASFYVACRTCNPQGGEAFVGPDGMRWSDRGEFFEVLTSHFKFRLARHADQAGLDGYGEIGKFASNLEEHHSPMPVHVHRA